MIRTNAICPLAVAGLLIFLPRPQQAAELRRLTLNEAVSLALSQNHVLKIARLRVAEKEQKKAGERSSYFPSISNQSNILHVTELQTIGIPAGAFGSPGGTLVPAQGIDLPQGKTTLFTSGTQISQPLTQLLRIREVNRIATADVGASREDLKKAENEVAVQVYNVYYGILIARLQRKAVGQETEVATERLRESEEDVRNGSALKVAALQGRTGVLQSRQSALTLDLQLEDLNTELNDLLGLPLNTELDLDPAVVVNIELRPREEYLQSAWADNPEISSATEEVQKAQASVRAGKLMYVPDVTAYARYSYQDGVPFLVRNFGTFGVSLSYDVFDFGKRRAAVREREEQLAQVEENLRRVKDRVAVLMERAYHKVERTRNLVEVTNEVVKLHQENERLAQNQLNQGSLLVSEHRQATADTYKAQADSLQANLGYLLAWAELQQAMGHTPRF
jgi:outer membrane protein TolC